MSIGKRMLAALGEAPTLGIVGWGKDFDVDEHRDAFAALEPTIAEMWTGAVTACPLIADNKVIVPIRSRAAVAEVLLELAEAHEAASRANVAEGGEAFTDDYPAALRGAAKVLRKPLSIPGVLVMIVVLVDETVSIIALPEQRLRAASARPS